MMAVSMAVAILTGILSASVILFSFVFRRPQIDTDHPRDVLILAAHPDDCVILAGEYAIEAANAGRSVRIAYLTCGSQHPGDDRAEPRRRQAIDAWSLAGVPELALEFLGLPASPLEGPSAIDAAQRVLARDRLSALIRELPAAAAVFIPADGELHSDHRTLRELALEALEHVGRPDICALEAPEYNNYYSLLQSPVRALHAAFRAIPCLGHLVRRHYARTRAGFVSGPGCLVLQPNQHRLAKKRDMLREFVSEDDRLLVHHFGHPDRYRAVTDLTAARVGKRSVYVRVGNRYLGPSVLCLWVCIWSVCFVLPEALVHRFELVTGTLMSGAVLFLAIALLGYALCRRHTCEKRVMLASVGAGLLAGVIPGLLETAS